MPDAPSQGATAKADTNKQKGTRLRAAILVWLAIILALAPPCHALEERYDYDAIGRLVRMVDGSGRVTEYRYDAAGNILSVTSGLVQAAPPQITAISPSVLRRGGSAAVTISGANLANVEIQPSDPNLDLSGLSVTATRISFTLSVGAGATLGASSFRVSNAAGAASTSIQIAPLLPVMSVEPTPLAVPPDNVARNFILALSNSDTVAHTITASSLHAAVATVSSAPITLAAGATQAQFQVTGKSGGNALFHFDSPTLGSLDVPVFVTADFRGISTATAPIVGVQIPLPPTPPPSGFPGTLASTAVGVVRGAAWLDTHPRDLALGDSGLLTFSGREFSAGLGVSIQPADGLTLGEVSVAADGRTASLPVQVDATAVTGLRLIALTNAGQALPVSTPGADRLNVIHPLPVVTAIEPLFGLPGTTISAFTIRGRNLRDVTSASFGSPDITLGSNLQSNADGTALTAGVVISPVATLGSRVVTVGSSAGSSGATPTVANTFRVVADLGTRWSDITAPVVGLQFDALPPPAASSSYSLATQTVGVSYGSAVNSVSPSSGARGQSLNLVMRGLGLEAVSGISFTPGTGITAGSPAPAADGTSVTVPLSIAADAPLAQHALKLTAGAQSLPFAGVGLDRFSVSAPMPEITGMDPIVIQPGTTLTLGVYGKNFQGATSVRASPPVGLAFSQPVVDAGGISASVALSVAADTAAGTRAISILTPAGESNQTSTLANTLSITPAPGPTYSALSSSLVGITYGQIEVPSQSIPVGLVSPAVGVLLDSNAVSSNGIGTHIASNAIGVLRPPVVLSISPRGTNRGDSGNFTITGTGLAAGTSIVLEPATGIDLDGAPVVAADGSSITQHFTVTADAVPGLRRLRLTQSGTDIPFAAPEQAMITVATAAPHVISLSPILARAGEVVSLTIRGTNLTNLLAVTAEPADGMQFATSPLVAADGSQVQLNVYVQPDAPIGARVIRVFTASGASSADASPANTFTVYAQ